MMLSLWKAGAHLCVLLSFSILFVACNGDNTSKKNAKSGPSMAIETEDTFKVPPGADPAVPAAMGGKGFEAIAADSGWQTSSIPADKFHLVSDSSAVKGGRVTFSFTDFPATFRAYGKDENTQATRFIHGLVYESMIGINPLTFDFLPSLATHWKSDPDGQTYYYRINPNARFSDGHPVTSEDVLATYKLGSDPGILSPYINSFMAEFDPPVAVSKYIVKVRSKEKNWKNMFYFGGLTIMPAHVIGAITGKEYLDKFQYLMPPGTGPYVIRPADVVKGESITITRRTNWWQKDNPQNLGTYNFDKVKIVIIRDDDLRYEKFRGGELDFDIVSRAQWWKTKYDFDAVQNGAIQKRKIYTDNPVGMGGLAFNTRRDPFSDERVREALTLLFNRKQILEKVLYNEYILTYSYYPNSPYENPGNPHYGYNPERAAQLLAEAGYTSRNSEGILVKNGQPFEIDFPVLQQLNHVITPIKEDFRNAGVKLNIRYVDGVTQFKLVNDRNFDMVYQSWGGLIYPNPISSFHSRLADQKNTNNITGMENARVDELCELEQVTFDQAKRVEILQELDSILVVSKHYALNWHAPFTRIVYWNKFGHPEWYLGKIGDWQSIIYYWWADPEQAAELAEAMKDKSKKLPVGPTDIMFWPEYNKTHPLVPPATYGSQSGAQAKPGDSSAKPSIK